MNDLNKQISDALAVNELMKWNGMLVPMDEVRRLAGITGRLRLPSSGDFDAMVATSAATAQETNTAAFAATQKATQATLSGTQNGQG